MKSELWLVSKAWLSHLIGWWSNKGLLQQQVFHLSPCKIIIFFFLQTTPQNFLTLPEKQHLSLSLNRMSSSASKTNKTANYVCQGLISINGITGSIRVDDQWNISYTNLSVGRQLPSETFWISFRNQFIRSVFPISWLNIKIYQFNHVIIRFIS